MCDEQHGDADPPYDGSDLLPEFEPKIGVQIGERLVEEQYPRLGDQLVSAVAARLGIDATPPVTTEIDEYARKAREVIVANAAHVFSRI